jgi:hypothetical protein
MPFTFHCDLYSIYWRAHDITFHHTFFPYYAYLLAHYIHAFFLGIFKIFSPALPNFWSHPFVKLEENLPVWEAVASHPQIYRVLFLLKLPYLLFDLASAFLLLRLLEKKEAGKSAFKFWMVNPVSIFGVYLFGRFETIPIFFILLSLYYIKIRRNLRASFWLGVSILTRVYPVLFIPFYTLVGKGIKERVKILGITAVPFLGLEIIRKIGGVITNFSTGSFPDIHLLPRAHHASYPLSMKFSLFHHDILFVFIAGYVLLLCYTASFAPLRPQILFYSLSLLLLFFFATSFFHPQYFMWLMPFLVLDLAKDKRFLNFYIIVVVCFGVYILQWGKFLTQYIFAPIAPRVFLYGFSDPREVISKVYPCENLIGIARSIFSGILLWMMWLIFKKWKSENFLSTNINAIE